MITPPIFPFNPQLSSNVNWRLMPLVLTNAEGTIGLKGLIQSRHNLHMFAVSDCPRNFGSDCFGLPIQRNKEFSLFDLPSAPNSHALTLQYRMTATPCNLLVRFALSLRVHFLVLTSTLSDTLA